MSNIDGTTRRQTLFLRAFRTNPAGPEPADWPSPALLRRWLRKPAFIAALRSVQQALRFQTDFQLSSAASNAARKLASNDADLTTQDLNRLLRHAHLRQRFHADASPGAHHTDGEDDEEDDDLEEVDQQRPPSTPPERKYIVFGTNNRPIWVANRALLDKLAFSEGYTAPLKDWPDFPSPTPQDTFFCHLVQQPESAPLVHATLRPDHRRPSLLPHPHALQNPDPQ